METVAALPGGNNVWEPSRPFEMRIYLSKEFDFKDFYNKKALVWYERGLKYDWDELNLKEKTINVSFADFPDFQSNVSIFSHSFFSAEGQHPDPSNPTYDELTLYRRHELTEFVLEKERPKTRNLLTGVSSKEDDLDGDEKVDLDLEKKIPAGKRDLAEGDQAGDSASFSVVRYWKPELTLHLVLDIPDHDQRTMPQQFKDIGLAFHSANKFYPPVYANEFWLVSTNFVALNKSLPEVSLKASYSGIGFMKWSMQANMERSWEKQRRWGTQSLSQQDEIKRMLQETNPYLLAVTGIVTFLHTIFDCLAFKNDISFWRNKQSLKGLSTKSIVTNTIFHCIILLYLLDNDTSRMILVSNSIGLLIQFWKVSKILKFDVLYPEGAIFPSITVKDHESYVESDTKEYDDLAMAYLMPVMYPLLIAYAIYSLLYNEHKGFYSWILTTAVGFIYAFGFILMTPQLFINYKLKSVAHLPWRKMVYKSLGTFIDDLFAFIIKMPTLHRLACLRDDIVFFIFLYQKWIYSVDLTRANEYGLTGEQEKASEKTRGKDANEEKEMITTTTAADEENLSKKKKTE